MVKQYKVDAVSDLVQRLTAKKNIILTNYSGIPVSALSTLRRKLRDKGADYKVVKNNLFIRALRDTGYTEIDSYVKGPVAVTFTGTDPSEAAKVLKEFQKEFKQFSFTAGVIDNVTYREEQIRTIADLPSREAVLAQIMGLINGPARGIATGANQIMASLARAIQQVGEKNG
ncbi:MAG TPA: 50S ribosomal protein L10 [Spirochaetota bacterium]|nr:50S ribosomal protein L10 [Spirochaetota bacterium]HNT11223.1 50S ribosomal protein L10 [Spirochaetota bacterium]HNV47990.1 50S ribosomal protein L10 [Spirochaetota bacterium]HPU88912.1 50S ribosomal protein L10 [Spirochaetota bacterium]